MNTARRLALAIAWLGFLTGVLAWAVRLPVTPDGTPQLIDPASLARWLPAADPAVVTIGVLRAIVVAVTAWMLVTTSVAMAAALIGRRDAVRAVLAVSPGLVRRIVGSVTLTATVITSMGPAVSAQTPTAEPVDAPATADTAPLTATLRLLDDAVPDLATPPADELSATLARISDGSPAVDRSPSDDAVPSPADAPPDQQGDDRSTWVVRTGDSFWRIAEEVVGRTGIAADQTLIDYWHELVEANRDELVDRDNPDLLLPGQVLDVPRPPG